MIETIQINGQSYNVDEEVTNRTTFKIRYKPEPGKVLNASYRNVKNPNNTTRATVIILA